MKRIALISSLVLTVTLTTLAPVASAAETQPRAMPTDHARGDVGNATKQYGIPRAMPSHYGAVGVTLGQQVGLPRAMPSDYAAAGIDVRPTQTGGRSHGVSSSSSDVLVAVALGLAGAVLLTGLTLVLRARRHFAS